MRGIYRVAMFIFIFAAGPGYAIPIEIHLEYQPEGSGPNSSMNASGYTFIETSTRPPAGVKGSAEGPAASLFGTVLLGDSKFPFAASKNAEGKFSRLVLDINANSEPTDDQPIQGEVVPIDDSAYQTEWRTDLTYQLAGKNYPVVCRLIFSTLNPDRLVLVTVAPYRGRFSVDGREYAIVISDANANGVYGESVEFVPGEPAGRGDSIFFAPSAASESAPEYEWSDYISFAGAVYKTELRFTEAKLLLTPVESGLEKVKLPEECERIAVWNADQKKIYAYLEPGREFRAPAGKYRLVKYQLRRKDEAGNTWLLEARAGKETPEFGVGTGPAPLFGEPFRPEVSISEFARTNFAQDPNQVPLELIVAGAGKEVVTDLARLGPFSGNSAKIAMSEKAPRRPAEPVYRLVTGDGEVVSQGNFEYG